MATKSRVENKDLFAPANPMKDPLVTVVTPTWDHNKQLISKCIPSVRSQTYPYIQHLVICDGIDFGLRKELDKLYFFGDYVELGRNWDIVNKTEGHDIAKTVGAYLAKGKYVVFLDDDDFFKPTDIEKLVKKIEKSKSDHFTIGKRTIYKTESL